MTVFSEICVTQLPENMSASISSCDDFHLGTVLLGITSNSSCLP